MHKVTKFCWRADNPEQKLEKMQIDHTDNSRLWSLRAPEMTCKRQKTTKVYCVIRNSVCAIVTVLLIFVRTKCGADCCLKLERANFRLPYIVTLKVGVVYGPQCWPLSGSINLRVRPLLAMDNTNT